MGCFNVACGVSSLSIGDSEEAVFVPLLPKFFRSRKEVKVEPASSINYVNAYYNPFSLPIKGKYNDYGTLEDVVRDENVEIIEKFFGISAEDIMYIVGEQRKVSSKSSKLYELFAEEQTLTNKYDVPLNEELLLAIGFTKTEDRFVIEGLSTSVALKPGKKDNDVGYDLYNRDGIIISSYTGMSPFENLYADFLKHAQYYLNVARENQERVMILSHMSGMFVHGKIYEEFTKEPSEHMLKLYDDTKKAMEIYDKGLSEIEGDKEKAVYRLQNDPFSTLSEVETLFHSYDYKEVTYCKDLYKEAIREGKLREGFATFVMFQDGMNAINRFYFPTMNGTQHGDEEASKRLYEISLEIVNEKIRKYEEGEW